MCPSQTLQDQEQLINLLLMVSRKLRILYDARIGQYGLTLARARVLRVLKDHGKIYQKDLAHYLNIEHATIVRLIDALEIQGFVERDVSKEDRRAKYLDLTPKGHKMIRGIERFSAQLCDVVLADVSQNDTQKMLSLLIRMADIIEKEGRL
ncbi:MarR family winged helix-turn-helix transcriptional regulator [Bartonella tamiae]|uniref:HTH marR-type domain-containing protein n=1 Tax=Bartonella tamiae Th239 TaxID=1094558 RepID=J1K2S5_9HYPH|nr:MarR family transcriptional regulator [Bartonella tamiae]EJF91797.1 hypothetical protein ME5_00176 [Bartonella tamiae Th239]EJF92535.1 hypothetical protein MEG_01705 [Bartonella tamiae Th307]